jgi:hypothetical protein
MNEQTQSTQSTQSTQNMQNMQYQQMQLLGQMTQVINNANAACGKGTECYKKQQVMDAQSNYRAALLTEKKAPEMVESARRDYLVAAKGSAGANQALRARYQKNGEEEKAKLAKEFDDWHDDMSRKLESNTTHVASMKTLTETNATLDHNVNHIAQSDDDATNELNLLERKTHYMSQDVKLINGVEYYVKLVYWLAFLTWLACILYERRFTMKTGGLFVLFTLFILLQNRAMNLISFIMPTDVNVRW